MYQPALTDFIVMTRENSHMFVTGPDVVAATTGEKVTLDELGGAAIHNFQSGVAHHMATRRKRRSTTCDPCWTTCPPRARSLPPNTNTFPNPEDEAAARAVADLVPTSARQP